MGILKKVKNKKWFQALGKIAPKIAGALGGPFGGLAENVLEEVLGMGSDATMEEIAKGSPEVFERLRLAEIEFEGRMEELKIEEQDLYLKDVQSAREMHISNKDWTPVVLTGLAIVSFVWLSWNILEATAIVEANERFVWLLLGSVIGWVTQGFNFYLGSSKGSQRKTDILANGKSNG
jgi:hypothetical protein